MSQKERDAEINVAVDRGDAWLVASVVTFPDLLTGKTSLTKAQLTDLFIKRASPELEGELNTIETALEHLKFAEETFLEEAARMSDIEAEIQANNDAAKVANAQAVFAKAMGSSA